MAKAKAKARGFEAVVLFYPACVKGRWVAHCLDFDLVGTGDDTGEAFAELLGTLEVQVELWQELGSKAAPPKRAPDELWEAARTAIELPPLDMGELKGWAEQYAAKRKKKLKAEIAKRVPKACRGALITKRVPRLALA